MASVLQNRHAQVARWKNELLPHMVDRIAETTPDAVYICAPRSTDTYAGGFREITYHEFANVINGLAHWLHNTLGPSLHCGTLAYIGPNDIRITALALAAVKAGYGLLLPSSRNSVAAQVELFKRAGCSTILSSAAPVPAPVTTLLREAGEESGLQHRVIPTVDALLDKPHLPYLYTKTYPEARDDPLVIIHTSGSTGFPKPIVYTHEYAARMIASKVFEPPAGFTSRPHTMWSKRMLNMFPLFHAAGLVHHLFYAIPFGMVNISVLPNGIPTAQSLVEMLHQTSADFILSPPSILLELSQSSELLSFVAGRVSLCLYSGGDLPQAVGDTIAAKLCLRCHYGSSEYGSLQVDPIEWDKRDWRYISFAHPLGMEFVEPVDSGSEAVIKRTTPSGDTQAIFTLFPEKQEFRTGDLFKRHPTKPQLWAWNARADDLIIFLNGEKTDPSLFEQHVVAQSPEVSTAFVVGAQRFQAALLIEPADNTRALTTAEEAALIETVWPRVQEANSWTPVYARIDRSMILPMSIEKPVQRAGKGTVQKPATVQQYLKEIDKLYQDADRITTMHDSTSAQILHNQNDITDFIREIVRDMGILEPAADSDNFFDLGLDSLGALNMTRRLRARLPRDTAVSLSVIYSNPSILRLAENLHAMIKEDSISKHNEEENQRILIETTLKRFEGMLMQSCVSPAAKENPKKECVILTGSTGTLGAYLLDSLLEDASVHHVHCFNRREEADLIYRKHGEHTGRSHSAQESRVSFHVTNLTKEHFGLDLDVYEDIKASTTRILHNAWPVNFNLMLDSFMPLLQGLVNLISFCSSTKYRSSLFFTSSISTVLNHHSEEGIVPEKVMANADTHLRTGYAQSKWISEMLCDHAAAKFGIPIQVARLGQVAGAISVPGLWNPTEWFPSLMRTSMSLHMIPDDLGRLTRVVDWMPVDVLADAILDLALQREIKPETRSHQAEAHGLNDMNETSVQGVDIYHLRNPSTNTWTKLLPGIEATMQRKVGNPVDVVSFSEWIQRVKKQFDQAMQETSTASAAVRKDEMERLVAQYPAVRLLDYYIDAASDSSKTADTLDVSKAVQKSKTLANMPPVAAEWLDKWIAEWISNGAMAPS